MAGIQLVGVSGANKQPSAPTAPTGRIDATALGQKITAWNPTPEQIAAQQQKAQAAAEMAAATQKTKQAGATGFWGRIQATGKAAYNGVAGGAHATIETAARILPGGQNDIKAQNEEAAQVSKTTQQATQMIKTGKATNNQRMIDAGKKLLGQNTQDANTAEAGANDLTQSTSWKGQQEAGKTMIKGVGNGIISSEKTVATGIARELPGGMNDIKAEEAQSEQASQQTQQAVKMIKSGDPKQVAAGKKLLAMANQNSSDAQKSVSDTVKSLPSKKELAAGFVGTGADILTAGGGKLLTQGGKYVAEKGVQKGLVEVGSKGLQRGVQVAEGTTAGAANAQSTGASGKATAVQAAIGAFVPIASEGAQKVFKSGSEAMLDKVKSRGAPAPPTPEEASAAFKASKQGGKDLENIDQAAASANTKIPVADQSNAAEKLGVKTPVRPGIKEVSTTDAINVRTPQKMSDDEFHASFQKLSDQYDKESKQLQTASKVLPQKTVQVKQDALEAKYQGKLNNLADAYHNPELSAPKAPKTISKSTTPAGKTTGGVSGGKTVKAPATAPADSVVHTSEGKMTVAKDATPRDPAGIPTGQPSGNKTAGLASNVEKKAIAKNLTDGFGDLPEYHTINMKEQADRAAELVSSDRAKALSIARGDEPAPAGLKALSVHQALQHQALKEGDAETLRHLSQSKLTVKTSEGAQDLRILRERDPNDPVAAMKDIADKRAARFEKQAGKSADKAISEEAGKYKKAVVAATKAPSKDEWKMFLESIKC